MAVHKHTHVLMSTHPEEPDARLASWQLWLIQGLISQRGDEQDLIPPRHDLWLGGGSKERDTPPSPGWLNTFVNARILYARKQTF